LTRERDSASKNMIDKMVDSVDAALADMGDGKTVMN